MKRLTLLFALWSVVGNLFAQSTYAEKQMKKGSSTSATENMFTAGAYLDLNDYVYLKSGKVIFELRETEDYARLNGLDSILMQLQNDIGFYHDSLENGSGNVRIDYAVQPGKELRKLRFIKYPVRGEAFVINNDKTERLKIERDTIRVTATLVQELAVPSIYLVGNKKIPGKPGKIMYEVQITVVLNNYKNLDKIIAERDVLYHAMDTLASVRTAKENKKYQLHQSSCIYHPYVNDSLGVGWRFKKFPYLIENEHGQIMEYRLPNRHIAFYANMGMGVTRNELTPSADAGLTYLKYVANSHTEYFFTSLYVSSLFFFERDANRTFYVHDNWFVNIVSGNSFDKEILGLRLRGISVGGGYLIYGNGDYFRNTTIKIFSGLRLNSGLTLSPEVIATNNFKQIFPGMTLKIFGFKRES